MYGMHDIPGQEHGEQQSCHHQRPGNRQRQQKPAPCHSLGRLRLGTHRLLIQVQQAVTAPPKLMKDGFKHR